MTDWEARAECRKHDPDKWFSTEPRTIIEALDICDTCPVKTLCLTRGMRERYGIYGGKTAASRARLRRTQ
jgi:WhiB family redox-sensing transcriptional regulator